MSSARPWPSSSPGPPGYVIFILQMFFQEECVSQAAKMRKFRPSLLGITALGSSPLRLRHGTCFCRLAQRAEGSEQKGLALQEAANRALNVPFAGHLWSGVGMLLSGGASTGMKTGGLLASVWDCLQVAGVSAQCLREKSESCVCTVCYHSERKVAGCNHPVASSCVLERGFYFIYFFSVCANKKNKKTAIGPNFNQSNFICTALNHRERHLKVLCTIRRKTTGPP